MAVAPDLTEGEKKHLVLFVPCMSLMQGYRMGMQNHMSKAFSFRYINIRPSCLTGFGGFQLICKKTNYSKSGILVSRKSQKVEVPS